MSGPKSDTCTGGVGSGPEVCYNRCHLRGLDHTAPWRRPEQSPPPATPVTFVRIDGTAGSPAQFDADKAICFGEAMEQPRPFMGVAARLKTARRHGVVRRPGVPAGRGSTP